MTVLTTLLFSALAGPYNDVSLTVGHQAGLRNLQGLNVTYGVNVGLTKRLEGSICVMGDRNTGTSVPGNAINMFVNAGLMLSMHNDWGFFAPTTAYVSFTPLTLGSSVIGRRERLFEVGVSYNWAENKVGFFFSLFKFDYYVHGTWRDYVK